MKRLLLFISLLIPISLVAEDTDLPKEGDVEEYSLQREKSSSKTVEFLSNNSIFIKKEFYDLPDIGRGANKIESEVVILTDLTTNKKIGCVRLNTRSNLKSPNYRRLGFFRDRYTGVIDYEELDDCIGCLETIQSEISETTPETYTELIYSSFDGVKLGAYSDLEYGYSTKWTWTTFVKTNEFYIESNAIVKEKDFPQLIQILRDAKGFISSKIK